MHDTLSQGYAFLTYLYAGIMLAIVYDALHIVICLIDRRAVMHVCDAVFALVFGAVVYIAVGISDSGVVRLYGLGAMACGAGLTQWAFGRAICKRIVKRRA